MCGIYLRIYLISLLISWPAVTAILARDTINRYSVEDTIAIGDDLFGEGDPVSITLIYDIKNFIRNKYKDEYFKARLIYHFNDTIDIEKDIRLKTRGKNRLETCPFPPIWINIRKANVENRYLKGTTKIKMVTHCANSRDNVNIILKEFLAYKIYNLISPYSFRVRLVKVKYVDTGRKNKEYNSWGFFIEPEKMLAERMDAFPLKIDHIGFNLTEPGETDIMAVFQFLIGNADYSIAGRHNVKLLKLNDPDAFYPTPVPYDFDYSGFVNAYYAVPGDKLGITSVTERYFLGPCRTEETFRQVIDYFLGKREEIYQLLESFEYLNEREKKASLFYMDEFFNNAGNPGYIKNNILSTCRDLIEQK